VIYKRYYKMKEKKRQSSKINVFKKCWKKKNSERKLRKNYSKKPKIF